MDPERVAAEEYVESLVRKGCAVHVDSPLVGIEFAVEGAEGDDWGTERSDFRADEVADVDDVVRPGDREVLGLQRGGLAEGDFESAAFSDGQIRHNAGAAGRAAILGSDGALGRNAVNHQRALDDFGVAGVDVRAREAEGARPGLLEAAAEMDVLAVDRAACPVGDVLKDGADGHVVGAVAGDVADIEFGFAFEKRGADVVLVREVAEADTAVGPDFGEIVRPGTVETGLGAEAEDAPEAVAGGASVVDEGRVVEVKRAELVAGVVAKAEGGVRDGEGNEVRLGELAADVAPVKVELRAGF